MKFAMWLVETCNRVAFCGRASLKMAGALARMAPRLTKIQRPSVPSKRMPFSPFLVQRTTEPAAPSLQRAAML